MTKDVPESVDDAARFEIAPRCRQCEYPLLRLAENRCPECGRGFDPGDPSTFTLPATKSPDRTVREILVMGALVALFAASRVDIGEWLFQLIVAGGILFAVARYYATRNDAYWLTPWLFAVGFVTVCWVQAWRLSPRTGLSLFDVRVPPVALIVGAVGAIALGLMKAETHALRKAGPEERA